MVETFMPITSVSCSLVNWSRTVKIMKVSMGSYQKTFRKKRTVEDASNVSFAIKKEPPQLVLTLLVKQRIISLAPLIVGQVSVHISTSVIILREYSNSNSLRTKFILIVFTAHIVKST